MTQCKQEIFIHVVLIIRKTKYTSALKKQLLKYFQPTVDAVMLINSNILLTSSNAVQDCKFHRSEAAVLISNRRR